MLVAPVQDLQQRPVGKIRPAVELSEVSRSDPRAEHRPPGVRDRGRHILADRPVLDVRVAAAGGQQPQQVRLPRPVRAEHGHPLAVEDLQVERFEQSGQREVVAHHGALGGPASAQPHGNVLHARHLLGRSGGFELGQPGHGGLIAGGEPVVVGGLDLVHQHEGLELVVLLVPPSAEFLEPGVAVLPGLWVAGERPAVHPGPGAGAPRLERDDPVGGVDQ